MDKDNIKEYIVCVNGGSGVVFQPKDEMCSYILTAKHVFDDIDVYDNSVVINRFDPISQTSISVPPYKLEKNINYFPHEIKDVAILKISRLTGAKKLIRIDDFDSLNSEIGLYGFPNMRRDQTNFLDWIREDLNLTLSLPKSEGKREAVLADNSTWEELVGQSGGGVFKIQGDCLGLLGIQNEVPNRDESKGRIEFSPLHNFDEIIISSNGELEELIPCCLKCFSFSKDNAFNFTGGIKTGVFVEKVTSHLRSLHRGLLDNAITPQFLIKEYGTELLLLNGQNVEHLSTRKLWVAWLELLILRNFIKSENCTKDDVVKMKDEVRLFYSDTDNDFFFTHLEDLAKSNYLGLKKGGIVLVASNVQAVEDYSLDTSSIPEDISKLKTDYEWSIGESSEFPLEKYRFIDISAFKEKSLIDQYDLFENKTPQEQLAQLQTVYNAILDV